LRFDVERAALAFGQSIIIHPTQWNTRRRAILNQRQVKIDIQALRSAVDAGWVQKYGPTMADNTSVRLHDFVTTEAADRKVFNEYVGTSSR